MLPGVFSGDVTYVPVVEFQNFEVNAIIRLFLERL